MEPQSKGLQPVRGHVKYVCHDGTIPGTPPEGTPPKERRLKTPSPQEIQEPEPESTALNTHNSNLHSSSSTSTNSTSSSFTTNSTESNDSIDLSILFNCLQPNFDVNWDSIKNFHVPIENSVVNLSDLTLSPAQTSLLSKGLSFCPMPGEPNLIDLKNDLFKFERNLKWKLHFANQHLYSGMPSPINPNGTSFITIPQSTSTFESPKFKNKSERPGPIGPPNLETLFLKAHQDLENLPLRRTPLQNLTPEENREIFALKITLK